MVGRGKEEEVTNLGLSESASKSLLCRVCEQNDLVLPQPWRACELEAQPLQRLEIAALTCS